MNIANDRLTGFTGTQKYYEYHFGNVLTDGALELAKEFECFWFLEIICLFSDDLQQEEFQVWTLEKSVDESARVICTDGNNNNLITILIPWTNFSADKAIIWKESNVLLLPSEH